MLGLDMELRHLRYFIAVAETENVTRAASALRVSQPSLSRQIRDLEDELGVELFERGPRTLVLTETGRAFLDEARAVMRRLDRAVEVVRESAEGGCGEIHVGYAPSLAVDLLPKLLRRFEAERPKVRVRLHDLSSAEMLGGLREQRLHVALLVRSQSDLGGDLGFVELESQPVCVAMHLGHPLAAERRVGFRDLAGEALVGFSAEDYPEYRGWVEGLFASGGAAPRFSEEHDGISSLIAAIEAGRGVAMVSLRMVAFAGGRLKVVPIHPAPPPLSVGVAWLEGGLTPAAAHFCKIAAADVSRK